MEEDKRTYAIIGAAIEVHKTLGCGFLEPVYQEALAIEFKNRDIPFEKEVELPIHYKGTKLASLYRADFICFESIIVELKAIAKFGKSEHAQIINYLNATGLKVGLIFNFAAPSLEYKRFVN